MTNKRAAPSQEPSAQTDGKSRKKRYVPSICNDEVSTTRPVSGKEAASLTKSVSEDKVLDPAMPNSASNGKEEDVTTIRSQSKPSFILPPTLASRSLQQKLQSFLPDLAQSNEDLQKNASNIEDVEEEHEHIVMELGLGVLEQQPASSSDSDTSNEDSSSDDTEDGSKSPKALREGAIQELLGSSRMPEKATIQEVD